MKSPFLAIALVVMGAVGSAANADVVHNTVDAFDIINASQGKKTNDAGTALVPIVDANRNRVENMFDGSLTTAFSLGLGDTPGNGGSLVLTIKPTTNVIASGSLVEWTNLNSGHQESATVSLGVDGGSWEEIGTLKNTQPGNVASFSNLLQPYALLSLGSAVNTVHTTFVLTVLSGNFNSLRFQDTSPYLLNGTTKDRDGFDIANLSVTSVPEPTALALAGAALLVLGAARRFKA
ncbi:MAG: hypothetical protein J0M00_03105 [Burkholderiales bacterium]|nr:hypothetical protein [Burkholderiales bacterium]